MALKIKTSKKSEKKTKKKKSALREWIDAIVFAVIAATIIRWALVSAYTIPTASMESTQLVGDFLFVSKISYGPRTPKTLLRLPLTDNKIWGTNVPSYLDWIQLPMLRLPGFNVVENNDVVVFNYPDEEAPVDMKTHYIKRCLAIAGDTFQVKAGDVFINGQKAQTPPEMQFGYRLESSVPFTRRVMERNDLTSYFNEFRPGTSGNVYEVFTTQEKAAALEKLDIVKKIEKDISPEGQRHPEIFPKHPDFEWNEDFFGPLVIPQKGMTIPINSQNLALYGIAIQRYEHNEDVRIEGSKLYIEDKEIKEYTFKQDYYFMIGDNRHNSLDSRYWGYVPADHIVGQAWFTWLSLDYQKSFFKRVRWNRIFKSIR